MMIGDPKHLERFTRLGIDTTAEDFDASFGALSALLTQETLQVEPIVLPLPEGDGNA